MYCTVQSSRQTMLTCSHGARLDGTVLFHFWLWKACWSVWSRHFQRSLCWWVVSAATFSYRMLTSIYVRLKLNQERSSAGHISIKLHIKGKFLCHMQPPPPLASIPWLSSGGFMTENMLMSCESIKGVFLRRMWVHLWIPCARGAYENTPIKLMQQNYNSDSIEA